jgi:predicted nucleic acid-binding protein
MPWRRCVASATPRRQADGVRFVVDASVAVEYLLRTTLGRSIAPLLESAELLAPQLLDVEVLAVLRREVQRGQLEEPRAREVLEDLRAWPIERIDHSALFATAWSHRHNVSAYDAMYVAAAAQFEASVLTADGPLARAPSLGVTIQNLRG